MTALFLSPPFPLPQTTVFPVFPSKPYLGRELCLKTLHHFPLQLLVLVLLLLGFLLDAATELWHVTTARLLKQRVQAEVFQLLDGSFCQNRFAAS